MRAIALSALLVWFAPTGAAQITSRFNDTLAAMASALADHDAPAFLEHIDKGMPDYEVFKANIEALMNQADVHSGLDQIAEDGNAVDVDWTMQVTARDEPSQTERRRATVHLKFVTAGKGWKVVSLEPRDLFDPPKVRRR